MASKAYKKQGKENNNKVTFFAFFIVCFLIMLILFTGIAKNLSPDVDVTIGHEPETELKESGIGVKNFVDNRLKFIQMEDESSSNPDKNVWGKSQKQPDEENSVKEDEKSQKDEKKPSYEEIVLQAESKLELSKANAKNVEEAIEKARQASSIVLDTTKDTANKIVQAPTVLAEQTVSSKVVVGYYSSVEQAKVAQTILKDANVGVEPFIKDLGNGHFTLQVGSFSSRAKADSVAAELLRHNFPARVIQE